MTQVKFDFIQTTNQLLDHIADNGYAVIENALPEQLTQKLLEQAQLQALDFNTAKIGRQQDKQAVAAIRSDKTKWLNSQTEIETEFLSFMESLRVAINRSFYLGLFDYECHFARYEKGDFYKKHLDAFKGRSNRVFTTVFYLNTPEHGGELGIYDNAGEVLIEKVSPKAGTLVCFESERFPHQVFPANDIRYSIAGWFRTNNSVSGTIDPSQ